MDRSMMQFGLWSFAISIILGAFGAHAIEAMVSPDRLGVWETAVRYQAWTSLLLIGLGASRFSVSPRTLPLLATGIITFSGSLYLLVFMDMSFFGAITPLGGLLIIGGIILAAITLT